MQEELVSFETAKLAKEKGFPQLRQGLYYTKDKEHCLVGWGFKDDFAIYSAPTQSLLQKWLREVHNIHITIQRVVGNKGTNKETVSYTFKGSAWDTHPTYEEALEIALQEELKLII